MFSVPKVPLSLNAQPFQEGTPQSLQELFLAFARTTDVANIYSPARRWYLLVTICQWYIERDILKEEFERSFDQISRDMEDILKIEPSPIVSTAQISEQAQYIYDRMVILFPSNSKLSHILNTNLNGDQTGPVTFNRRASLIETSTLKQSSNHKRSSSWPSIPQNSLEKPPAYEYGMEDLPSYTCSIHHEGFLHRKMEFNEHGDLAKDRSWR
ncbi:hypothetical protein K7432_006456 [Basidiobolus ranarum]|uniref:Uncharacterized protein n=1 Tax=Basidiobolus ranarum TaxID=34480 RepID=A0ABR2W1R2_9FUNG